MPEDDGHGTLRKFTVWEQESHVNQATGDKAKEYHFAVQAAIMYDSITAMTFVNTHPKVVDIDCNQGKRRFKKFSSDDVLGMKLNRANVEGKIVLLSFIGPDNEDKFFTPLNNDKSKPDMYGGEYLANIIAQVLESSRGGKSFGGSMLKNMFERTPGFLHTILGLFTTAYLRKYSKSNGDYIFLP